MMKPEPSDCASRVTGAPPRPPPPPNWPNRSPKGVPANGFAGCCTVTFWSVEMLTTAGWSLATMSAKLIGAPARGAAALIVPGSFCATCAAVAGCWSTSDAAVPPRRRAPVRA